MNRFIYKQNGQNNISGERIRELRLKNRLSQSTLAARLQLEGVAIGQNSISKIEMGTRVVTDYELLALSKIFNVSTDYLIGQGDAQRRGQ